MHNTTLIIPATDIRGTKSKEQLTRLLDSLVDYHQFDILICFDSVNREFIRYFQEKYGFFESVINKGNRLNFARNANLGIRKAIEKGHNVLLVNQDCVLPGQMEVQESLCQFVGITNPKCTNELPLPKGSGAIEEWPSKFPYFCTFLHYDVLSRIGILDGSFVSTCEDDDHIIRAKLAGFKTYVADIFVYHEGSFIDTGENWQSASGSYNQERLTKSVGKLFTKYQVPGYISHADLEKWVLENHQFKEDMYIA